ncbi:MAG: glycoside hydrolase family 127 protein [Paenibacillaceae bacterium]|nr:glycoside hydrolase family 127 protein [Paenibacillaceae bacterium]
MPNRTMSGPLPLRNIAIRDPFWTAYIKLVREVVVPYQWEALNDRIPGAEPSHAIENFKIAAGLAEGNFAGMVFQDSDVAKWLEAASYLLETGADPELERIADETIELIARAQGEDGYVNTYFTLKEPEGRWTNLAECHELYCAGHLIEAAVAYYRATGKRRLLDVASRMADEIGRVFGEGAGRLRGYDGHQEIELALVKLYRVTGNDAYLELARFFIDERGRDPSFYAAEFERRQGGRHFPELNMAFDRAYSQAHLPVRQQATAEGHAVRAVYMLSGMADIAAETDDGELLQACRRLWRNIVTKRMYVTGAIGSMAQGESFSLDYDLPGDTAYAETCASVGLIFFAHRMLRIETRSEYADVLERALYNTVIAGMGLDGKSFFYVNPLEVWPAACGANKSVGHVKPQRQTWFGCACCPPNLARLLASLGQYIYTVADRRIACHLYIGSEAEFAIGGQTLKLTQTSSLPWQGSARFELTLERPLRFALSLRIPAWSGPAAVAVNGVPLPIAEGISDGYATIDRDWEPGDTVELTLPMDIRFVRGHPNVRETAWKVALQRGPIVYCLEEADNGPGLHRLAMTADAERHATLRFDPGLLGGIATLVAPAVRVQTEEGDDTRLYRVEGAMHGEPVSSTFIPYFAWANRGIGEMSVWVRSHRTGLEPDLG